MGPNFEGVFIEVNKEPALHGLNLRQTVKRKKP